MSNLNPKTLVVICGYAGDKHQMTELMPYYEHHECPMVFLSPKDSQVHGMGPHICRVGGARAYVGQLSLDRQYEHFKIMLEYPFDYYLMNDSDSLVITPKLPDYLYNNPDTLFSNEVSDFRQPGKVWENLPPWPDDYHKGMPLIAMQPPYFFSRKTLQKIVDTCKGIQACPITPFIDWYFVQCCYRAGVKHSPFKNGASCETVTPLGKAVMSECISKRGANFIHSIKRGEIAKSMVDLYNKTNG